MRKNDYSIIKAANRKLILNTIVEFGSISITELIHKLKLSRPTVEGIVRHLLDEGIIEKAGFSKLGVGRSAQLYEIGQQRHISLGLDIEFPAIRIVVINLKRNNVYSDIFICAAEDSPEQILEMIKKRCHLAIDTVLNNSQYERKLLGIGVGICGQIDAYREMSLYAERAHDWKNIQLVRILKEEFQVPVSLCNDVHMLSLVRKDQRIRDNRDSYIYISLRSGIGMALFLRGELFSGMMGNAGFLGHTTVDIFGDQCPCGNRGCLENYISQKSVLKRYEHQKHESIIYTELLELLDKNDPTAVEIMTQAYNVFGKAVSNVIKITDVHNIILNGIPSQGQAQLIKAFREGIAKTTIPAIMEKVHIEMEEFSEIDAAKGGAQLMIQKFFSEPQLQLMPERDKDSK